MGVSVCVGRLGRFTYLFHDWLLGNRRFYRSWCLIRSVVVMILCFDQSFVGCCHVAF